MDNPKREGTGQGLLALLCLIAFTLWLPGCGATLRPRPKDSNRELLSVFQQQGIAAQEQGRG